MHAEGNGAENQTKMLEMLPTSTFFLRARVPVLACRTRSYTSTKSSQQIRAYPPDEPTLDFFPSKKNELHGKNYLDV
jgi:hypothetical protein